MTSIIVREPGLCDMSHIMQMHHFVLVNYEFHT